MINEVFTPGPEPPVAVVSLHKCFSGIERTGSTLLQDQNIGDNFRPCIALERGVRQPDRAEKVGLTGNVVSDGHILAVHGVAGRDEHHDAARSDFLKGLGEEIVMDRRRDFLRECPVYNGVVAEGDVSDCHVHVVVRDDRFLKALDAHVVLRVQVLGNQAGDVVQLYHGPAGDLRRHVCRHCPDKVSDAGRGFQHTPALEAEFLKPCIHGLDNLDAGIVGVGGAGSRRLVFLVGEKLLQFGKLPAPIALLFVECFRDAAPSDIAGKRRLLFRGGVAPFGFQLLHDADRIHVGLVPRLAAVRKIKAVADHIVVAACCLGGFFLYLLFGGLVKLFSLLPVLFFGQGCNSFLLLRSYSIGSSSGISIPAASGLNSALASSFAPASSIPFCIRLITISSSSSPIL